MTPEALLRAVQADGLHLYLEQGALRARGPGPVLERWTPEIRGNKPALVALLSAPANDPGAQAPDPDTTRRLWLVTLPTGERFSSSFTPPATAAEVLSWYPNSEIAPDDVQGGRA